MLITTEMIINKLVLLIKIILPIFTFFLGWKLNNRSADRPFLRSDVYIPLYSDIKQVAKNISEFERYNNINPPPEIGNTRKQLLESGQYNLIPKKLRKEIDSYYENCEEYNQKRHVASEAIKQICANEMKELKTNENHNNLLKIDENINNSGIRRRRKRNVPGDTRASIYCNIKFLFIGEYIGSVPDLDELKSFSIGDTYSSIITITKDDLNRNSISFKDIIERLIELVSQEESVIQLRELQKQLKDPESLIEKIEKRIDEPNPLIEILGV